MATTLSPLQWYAKGVAHLDLELMLSEDIRVILCSSLYVPDSTLHEYYDVDITNELPTANGYTVGGIALTTKTVTAGGTPGEYTFSSDNASWTATGGSLTARYYVLYNNSPVSNKELIAWSYLDYNSGTPQDVTVEATFALIISVSSAGWFKTAITNGVVV